VLDTALLVEKCIIESEPERNRVGYICVYSPQAAIFMIGSVT
jgi:hypothetical protein